MEDDCQKREVALKVFKDSPKIKHPVERLNQEISAFFDHSAEVISHPNIIEYIDYHVCGQRSENNTFIAMERMEDNTLWNLIDDKEEGEAIEDSVLIPIIKDTVEALAYLHRRRFIHRDIKPANILLRKISDDKYLTKLCDFGLSGYQDNLAIGNISGSPWYQSAISGLNLPEQDAMTIHAIVE
eukprot:gene9800-11449_t